MTENEIKQRILVCLNNTGIGISTFEEDIRIDEIAPDSLTFITLIIELENAFEIEIPAELLSGETFETLSNIYEYILNITSVL